MGFHPMRELRITDVELQKMIAPVLRKRLRKAGFAMGAASADGPPTYLFPINLDLAAFVTVIRREDGTWLFQQDDFVIAERLEESFLMHGDAYVNRANAPNKGERS